MTNKVTWIPATTLPKRTHIVNSDRVLFALKKRQPEVKPTIMAGHFDFERKKWICPYFGPVEAKVTHWQELNYPPEEKHD